MDEMRVVLGFSTSLSGDEFEIMELGDYS